eukprot:g4282.t1
MNKTKILIVEDDRILSEQLAGLLRQQDYQVDCSFDGEEGFEIASAAAHDLIVLDVMLPKKDGFSLLGMLRKNSQTPVIMLTAKGAEEERIKGLSHGADDYLTKPFNSTELILRIDAILRRSRAATVSLNEETAIELDELKICREGGSVGVAQKIYIRDLEDSKINITVDGAPQKSTLFHHIGRVTIDPDLLKEVEVQAGAGEATAGAGATGGAIRFKTKSADDLLAPDRSFGGKIKVNESTNDFRQYSGSLYGRISDSWGILGYYNDVERDNMEDGDGEEILASGADQTLGFFKVSGQIGDSQSLSLSYEVRDEEGEFSARPNWIVLEGDPLYTTEAQRDTFVFNYGIQQGDLLNLEVTAYQTESSFRGGRFDWLTEISTFGFDLRNTSVFGNHSLTYGVDYADDQVDSGYYDPQPEEDHREVGTVLGVYGQVHSQITEALLLSYGLRYDDYQYEQIQLLEQYYGDDITDPISENDASDVSVNIGFEYDLTDELSFGLGYAQALLGKEISDGFTIDSWLWDASTEASVDPDLEAETVSNIEASLNWESDNLEAELAVFTSSYDDVIYEFSDRSTAFTQNIGTLDTQGFEFDLRYRIDEVELSFGYSSVDSELDYDTNLLVDRTFTPVLVELETSDLNGYEHNGLGNASGDTLTFGVDYSLSSDISLGFNLMHTESLSIETLLVDQVVWGTTPYELEKPSYAVVDTYVEWNATDNLVFNLVVANLLDKTYRDHSSVGDYSEVEDYEYVVGPNEAGRDIRLSASFSF